MSKDPTKFDASQFDPAKVAAQYEFVAPAVAQGWLAGPSLQIRPENGSRVMGHARSIKSKQFWPGWDGVAFDEDDIRLNGQHRLRGIVEAGQGAWLLVIRGLPRGAAYIGDQGAKRTTPMVLAEMGHSNSGPLAAALRYHWQWKRGFLIADKSSRAIPTVTDLVTHLRKNPGLIGSVSPGLRLRKPSGLGSDGLSIMLWQTFTEEDQDEAEVFFDQLMHGTNLQEGDPILILRERLAKLRSQAGATKGIDVTYKAAIAIKAFNYWRAGVQISQIHWQRGGAHPEPFPAIEPPQQTTRVVSVAGHRLEIAPT